MATTDKTGAALPGVKHKVIGLVSGGKDSCFNLMHTVANGHEIVAIATLTPEQGVDELDSHMYQSVGTSLPPLIAKAMGLPHYSGIIKGKPVEQGPEYGSRERGGEGSGMDGDETEDLTALLKDVMAAHPDVTAVASGAILSNYQRLRIEHVCQRLGLTSLAYLWQSEQLPLVGRMISSGLNAILVKVAGIGLTERHVGKSLAQMLPLLTRLQAQYGAHPAGEGGEYETLTLDTPLFSHRIRIDESEVVVTDPEPNTVAYLRVLKAELEEKEGWVRPSVQELRELLELQQGDGEEGLDEQGLEVFSEVAGTKVTEGEETADDAQAESHPGLVRLGQHGRWFTITAEGKSVDGESVGNELRSCFEAVKARLAEAGLSLPLQSAHITLPLASMSDFPAANASYIGYFGTSPPSRATVAVPLPPGQRIRLEIVGFNDASEIGRLGGRSALHVQGLSYWAPANIGPYSQAVTVDSRLHIAGQIPLQPPSLTFAPYPPPPTSPYAHQAALALQHVRRIIDVLRNPNSTGGGWRGWTESCVAWWARPSGLGAEGPSVAQQAWNAWASMNECKNAPAIFVRASELPRGALVEYQVNVHTGRPGYEGPIKAANARHGNSDSDDDDDDEPEPVYARGEARGAYWETCSSLTRHGARAAIFLPDTAGIPELTAAAPLAGVLSRAVTVRVYHLPSTVPSQQPILAQVESAGACWTAVPVLGVQDRKGRAYAMALEVFAA